MVAHRPPSRAKGKSGVKGFERLFPILDMVLLLLGVAVVLSLSYFLWVVLRGDLGSRSGRAPEIEVIVNGVNTGSTALFICLWLLVIVALVRHYKNETIAYLVALGGLACWLGMPVLIGKYSPPDAYPDLQKTASQLIASFNSTGVALFVIGVLRAILGRIVLMTYQPSTATRLPGMLGPEVEIRGARHSIMRKCWELHFCRGSVRTSCPRYIEGIACWRQRSGCYCDHNLAGRLMASVGGNSSIKMQVAEELESQQRRAQELQKRLARQQRSKEVARKLCRECPIYNEHQKFKYRALSWLAYPATAVVVALAIGLIRSAYEWSDSQAAGFVKQFNFIPQHLRDSPIQVASWLNAENFFIVIIAVIVLAVVLQLIDMAVFKLKW